MQALRIDCDVTKFSGEAIPALPEFSLEDQAWTKSGPYSQQDQALGLLAASIQLFSIGGQVGVVMEGKGNW